MEKTTSQPPQKPTLAFDGECNFCRVWVDRWKEHTGDQVHYEVHGSDPFGYGPLPKVMTRAEVLEKTVTTDYPDAPLQVAQVFDSPRAGDFLISASPGYDLRWREGRIDMQSCHGTLYREHMMVPFAINHPMIDRTPRSVDAFPTILNLLGLGHRVPDCIDGTSLT